MKINARVTGCTVLGGERTYLLVFYGAILTGKTCLADHNHFGQNDHQLKLHTLINFSGTKHLVLIPIAVFNNNGCT